MMVQGLEVDLKDMMVSNASFGPQEIEQITNAIADDYTQFKVLRDAVGQLEQAESRTPATSVRLGVGLHLLGRYQDAVTVLTNADGGALA